MRAVWEVKDSEWVFLSALLNKFEFVRIQQTDEPDKTVNAADTPRFEAIRLNTLGFRFNREEANER
ncbi:hypothetical protein ACO2Q8_04375 [Larkinella sp. VNQ87]|uniref:hypothetical protein n=1 Tax=Larkinella sp. VNQ87 TaxID=3400921 RepID=UPI003C0980C2